MALAPGLAWPGLASPGLVGPGTGTGTKGGVLGNRPPGPAKVRSWPGAKKISHVQASFGTGTFVFDNGCGDKCFCPSLGHKTGKRGPCHGFRNFDMSRQAPVPVIVFSKMLVWANLFAQTLGTRRESEVLTMG